MINHGSLFSGIGGFDLAASWMGWNNIFSCEKDPICRKVLKHYWPNTKQYEDIHQFKATGYRGHVDVISGGFPCQPFSQAGRRKGTQDDRYLWPQARRVIEEVRPDWIVLENVAGLFTILEPESLSEMEIKAVELFCSDSEQNDCATIVRLQRRIIGNIIREIRSAGYLLPQFQDGTPILLCIPACAVGAPHRRDRVWFVAHSKHCADRQDQNGSGNPIDQRTENPGWKAETAFDKGFDNPIFVKNRNDSNNNLNGSRDSENEIQFDERGKQSVNDPFTADIHVTDTGSQGLERSDKERYRLFTGSSEVPDWSQWPVESPVCSGNDGISCQLDGITFSKWRQESIKAFGNAIVPQIAYNIFRAIKQSFYS